MVKYVDAEEYQGPDRRAQPHGITGAIKAAYDVGGLIRAGGQLIVLGAGILWAWNTLENTATANRDRILTLEATVRSHTERLGSVPLLQQSMATLQDAVRELTNGLAESIKQATAIREQNATTIERLDGVRKQIERLDVLIQSRNRPPPPYPGQGR